MSLPKCSPVSSPSGLSVSVLLAAELLKWASKDTTRFHLCSLGYVLIAGEPHLCATNGHTLVALPFSGTYIGAAALSYWRADYVTTQIALAKAVKAPNVVLAWDDCRQVEGKFPPAELVIPTPFPKRTSTAGFAGNYIAACGDLSSAFDRIMAPRKRALCDQDAVLMFRGVGSTMDPLRVDIVVEGAVVATCVVMPQRVKAPSGESWPVEKSKWDLGPGEKLGAGTLPVEIAA